MWDAGQYLRFGGERARPFFDLVAQIGATDPRHVADLGCGPGNLTAALAQRWPGSTVTGVDSSPEMIDAATALLRGGLGGSPPRRSRAFAVRSAEGQAARNLEFA